MKDVLTQLPGALVAVSIALVVAYMPGLAFLNRFAAFRRIDGLSRLFIAPGVSIALYVVLFTFCYKLGIKLGWWTPWLITLLAAASLLYPLPKIPRLHWTADKVAYIALAGVTVILLANRLYTINGLVAPMWGDSVHHTIIVQLMLENGGLFHSWQPYADVNTFTYHFGFHAFTTMYAWMRGISAEFAVLMMGQIANFCAVMGLYALARLWTRSVWGGGVAVIVGGFISSNPYYFVFWGRYTQLTGHIILLAALVLLSYYLASPRRKENLAYLLVLPLVIAGVGMAQYKVAVLFVALSAALVIFRAIGWYAKRRDLRYAVMSSLGRAGVIAGIALLVFMARGWDIVQSTLGTSVQRIASTELNLSPAVGNQQAPLLVRLSQSGFDNDAAAIWLAALAGVIVLIVKRRDGLWFVAGMGLCLIAMNPRLVGINRAGLVDEFHLSLSTYIAAAGLIGAAAGALAEMLASRSQVTHYAAALACFGLVWFGANQLPPLPLGSIFVLPDDVQMMAWIRENVPPGEKIAAPGFIAFKNFTVGRDAGWWIPFYTGHRTNLMFMAAEQEMTGVQRNQDSRLSVTKDLYTRDMSLPSSTEWLAAQGYRYFYIGAKPLTWSEADGEVNHAALIEQLLRNPGLRVLHRVGDAVLVEVGS
ncbi:MAG: hypothetical protein M1140_03360 [Chloroflexi bacterium]|nr:hypothetical protein [Chloroflexota bacterium]